MENPLNDLSEIPGFNQSPVSPVHVIAGVALAMAMKFHDINTVQDGTLYQQYKLEGKNMEGLHLDMVLDTAARIEAHLMKTEERLAIPILDMLSDAAGEEDA